MPIIVLAMNRIANFVNPNMTLSQKKFHSAFLVSLLVFLLSSCGSSDDNSDYSNQADDTGVLNLLSSSTTSIDDLEALLSEGNTTMAKSVSGANEAEKTFVNSTNADIDKSLQKSQSMDSGDLPKSASDVISENMEAEKALQSLEVSALEHQRSIEDLRKINEHKDKTIASLSIINDELLEEIRRIKGDASNEFEKFQKVVVSNSGVDGDLRNEIKSLKNSLLLKSSEIKDLRNRNDSLEARISSLEKSPVSKVVLADPVINSGAIQQPLTSDFETSFQSNLSVLNFDAVVTSYSGRSKEAFYTEFFILNSDLNSLLNRGGLSLVNYSGVESFSELWAQSQNNSFLFPNLLKSIREILMKQVEDGNGLRVRTDINGAASVELKPGNYFIIGCAALGKVGVTWNVPVNLDSGVNKVSLTLANASWSQ